MTRTMTPDEARTHFDAEVVYCNTATMGLPPRRTLAALESTLAHWRSGRSDAVGFDQSVERARAAFAGLVAVDTGSVAIGSVVSPFVGLVAASLPRGSEVLVAEGEFTSVSFPFLAQVRSGHPGPRGSPGPAGRGGADRHDAGCRVGRPVVGRHPR